MTFIGGGGRVAPELLGDIVVDPQSAIVVASAVDADYLPLALVVATSIASNARPGRPVEYHVLYDGPDHWALAHLDQFRRGPLTVRVHRLPNKWSYLGQINNFPPSTFFRLAIPEVLSGYARAIYLDCDTVVEADLSGLFDGDLRGMPMGAVPCVLTVIAALRDGTAVSGGVRIKAADYFRDVLGLDTRARQLSYMQAGVQLFDLNAMRQMNYVAQVTALINKEGDKLAYCDQCAANKVLRDQITHVDPRWNVSPFALLRGAESFVPAELKELVRRQRSAPGIVHYGGAKPWQQVILPGTLRWWRYAIASGAARYFLGVLKRQGRPDYRLVMADIAYNYPRAGKLLRKIDALIKERSAARQSLRG